MIMSGLYLKILNIDFGSVPHGGLNIITPDKKIITIQVNPPLNQNNRTEDILQTGPDQFVICGPNMGLCLIDEEKHTLEKIGLKEGLPNNNLQVHDPGQSGSDLDNLW